MHNGSGDEYFHFTWLRDGGAWWVRHFTTLFAAFDILETSFFF
jgi:hypothetical protein